MVDTTLAVLELLKSAYPAQYYGKVSKDNTLLLPVYDVWGLRDMMGASIGDISTIPPASDMVALTGEQVEWLGDLPARGAFNIAVDADAKTIIHAARYYCDSGKPACFYDTWGYSDISSLPNTSELHAITKQQWKTRQDSASTGLKDYVWNDATGTLSEYTAPVVVIPVAKRAQAELTGWIAQQASLASAMGQTFSPEMRSYVVAMQNAANEPDGSSLVLPSRPSGVLVAG